MGKGVCFDTRRTRSQTLCRMLLMKKDMGGAACTLGLAQMLMQLDAPVQLRVLIPAVENSVDGNAYRPSDVLRSRKGPERRDRQHRCGRTVGARRCAGRGGRRAARAADRYGDAHRARRAWRWAPSCRRRSQRDESLLATLRITGEEEADPIWPLPLWAGYDDELASKIADLGNVSAAPFAGSIIAALFLKRFVTATPLVAAPRSVRLERKGSAGPSGRRRSAMRTRALQADPLARWLTRAS